MIEINLIKQKKALKAPVVLGIDLAKLNFKMIILAFIVNFFASDMVVDYYNKEMKKTDAIVTEVRAELNKIKREVRKNSFIKDKLNVYRKQISKLKERSEQVDKIIKQKTNPFLVLEKLAKSAPENLWFETLEIRGDGYVNLKGGANSYQEIGLFINQVGTDPFFKELLQLKSSKTIEEDASGVSIRVESFEVEGQINIYDPFNVGS
ncbi:PilN domain-containing protein [Bacteriovoracaceae bacterium]|nr:PilN domain-containing protein [Bacteriovoracaceae bacterium]|tara:strand:+ start:239019 stop:239639 length:621 start_codon:yes stop_codon:yes gene_type:complete